ncbi:NAD-dependent epimerase/dehydratase family protein [Legionella lytica]|uniref:NAD-dependent epimerase/dehydratase family protein n=1 Tax=Legionella lytica TaxID=96232 RepID=A0ABW8D8V9_9GAMM
MKPSRKNVLITGGAGFIGSNLAVFLANKGHAVTVLDILSPQIHGAEPERSPLFKSIKNKVKFIHGSVGDAQLLSEILTNQDEIYHLAAETGTGQSMYEIARYFESNVQATAILLDSLANTPNSVKKILISSSRAVYGEGKYINNIGSIVYPKARLEHNMRKKIFNPVCDIDKTELKVRPTDEDSEKYPTSVYGLTKLVQENMIMNIAPTLGIVPVAVRYQNVYGPGQSLSNPYTGILAVFSTRILNGNPIEIFEDGLESRDFIYIDDVVAATALVMDSDLTANQVLNVGTGVAVTVKHVAESLAALYNKEIEINVTNRYRLGDIRHNFADIEKLKKLLNFTPKVSFDEGLKKFSEWVIKQEIPADQFNESLEQLKHKGLLKDNALIG